MRRTVWSINTQSLSNNTWMPSQNHWMPSQTTWMWPTTKTPCPIHYVTKYLKKSWHLLILCCAHSSNLMVLGHQWEHNLVDVKDHMAMSKDHVANNPWCHARLKFFSVWQRKIEFPMAKTCNFSMLWELCTTRTKSITKNKIWCMPKTKLNKIKDQYIVTTKDHSAGG